MYAAFFRTFAEALTGNDPICLATVVATRGAVPRHRGAMMWVSASQTQGTVGGGQLELRVLARARSLIESGESGARFEVDLGGGPDSAGVCGGRVSFALSRWFGATDHARASDMAASLQRGETCIMLPYESGDTEPLVLEPKPLLLLVGVGHCGAALARLAAPLGFRLAVFDTREDVLAAPEYETALRLSGPPSALKVLQTERHLQAVLLNRDYHADIDCLRVLAELHPDYVGMMGSKRREFEVRSALPNLADQLPHLDAPLGIEIGAETPEEIAISILARLIGHRRLKSPHSPPSQNADPHKES
ncbi:MAG: XdhC family protein [Ahniella sp.]|nr:XdhC family protein [Ahniella sp.]